MSQSPPPPPPAPRPTPVDGNPYARQPGTGTPVGPPAAGVPAAPGMPYPPQPGAFPAAAAGPAAPPAPARNDLVLGLLAGLGAGLVAAAVYGVVIGLTKHEIGWAAVGVGHVIGVAAGRTDGRNPATPVASAVFALGSVYLGQLVGEAVIGAKELHVGFGELFFHHFDVVQEVWKDDADPLTFVFFAIAAFAAFSGTKKAAA